MSLWEKIQNLKGEAFEQVKSLYGQPLNDQHFPVEVRHFLAPWIEAKVSEINSIDDQNDQYAHSLFSQFMHELEDKANSLVNLEFLRSKMKLVEAATMFQDQYSQNPRNLFKLINQCLDTEVRIIQKVQFMETGLSPSHMTDSPMVISSQLNTLCIRTQATKENLCKLELEQNSFIKQYQKWTEVIAQLTDLQNAPKNPQNAEVERQFLKQKEEVNQALTHQASILMELQTKLEKQLKNTLEHLSGLQSHILDGELIRWKRDQQLAGNGAKPHSTLDTIQKWCEILFEIIWTTRQQIKEAEKLKQILGFYLSGGDNILSNHSVRVTQLLSSLVSSTYIVEHQPPQVMKTHTKFSSTVRHLLGKALKDRLDIPGGLQVTVTIISESQANSLLKNEKAGKGETTSGDIIFNTGIIEYNEMTGHLSVGFRNLQLKRIKRAEKKGTESVMDEKFSLLFSSQFSIGKRELSFQVWTLSLPVVVIVHGNQEPHAWATITWDNAFSEPGRAPFSVPDKVPWRQVSEALNMKFTSATGRPLSDDNLKFLAEKAFRSQINEDCSNLQLSWSQFNKEALPERNFTFWEWFYAIMKLTREHIKGPWCDGSVLGFVRKKQAEEILATCAPGTFLLRFSDSELGGITIAWITESARVYMVQPFTSKDFAIRSLPDRINDIGIIYYLYPDIPKETAFSQYYTPFTDNQLMSNNGYVRPVLLTHIPGLHQLQGNNTPGGFHHHHRLLQL